MNPNEVETTISITVITELCPHYNIRGEREPDTRRLRSVKLADGSFLPLLEAQSLPREVQELFTAKASEVESA